MTVGRPPVASVAIVCRRFAHGTVTAPAAQWDVLMPAMAALGVDVTLVRQGPSGAVRRYLHGAVVVREVPLVPPRDAPGGLDAALWAQAAATELAVADEWRTLAVVEGPARGGETAHVGAVAGAARVVRTDAGPPDRDMGGALAAVAVEDAHEVAPPPVVVLARLRPDPAAADVVVLGDDRGDLVAALGAAGVPAVAAAPVTRTALVAALRRAAVLVLDGPGWESVAATALAAGVPVVATAALRVGPVDAAATPRTAVALADAVMRLRDDAAQRRAVRARAHAVRTATDPTAVARDLLERYADLPRRRAPRPVRLGAHDDGAGRLPVLDVALAGWRMRCAGPVAVSPGWRRTLLPVLASVPALGRAGPVGYTRSGAGLLERCPPGDRPCDVLWGDVTAARGDGTGRVWQLVGPWPVPEHDPPAGIPARDAPTAASADAVTTVEAVDGFHEPEPTGSQRPRWMADAGTLTVRVPRAGDWWVVLDAESFVTDRTLHVEGPGAGTDVHVPAGRRTLLHLRMPLPAGPVDLRLHTDPGADTPARVFGTDDTRPLSIRLWGATLDMACP